MKDKWDSIVKAIAALLIITCLSHSSIAQERYSIADLEKIAFTDSTIFKIELTDHSVIVGKLIRNRSDHFVILTENFGSVVVRKNKISSIEVLQGKPKQNQADDSRGYPYMVGGYRNLISSNGFNLEKGEANIQFTELFFVSGAYGITNNISITGGMSFVPGLEFSEQVFFVLPKFSVEIVNKWNASAYVFPLFNDGGTITLYGIANSYGSRDKNITLGYTGSFDETEIGLMNFSATYRTGRKFALLTNNMIPIGSSVEFDLNTTLLSVGGRLIGENGSFDFGFVFVPEAEGFPLPLASYTLRL